MDNSAKLHLSKKVLIVEDDILLQNALNNKLTHVGFAVIVAGNGSDALKTALDYHPDIILLDLVLPGIDGITMLKSLREDEWGKNVPVIITSNLTSEDAIQAGLENGVNQYLIKSDWSLEGIVKKVKDTLSASHS